MRPVPSPPPEVWLAVGAAGFMGLGHFAAADPVAVGVCLLVVLTASALGVRETDRRLEVAQRRMRADTGVREIDLRRLRRADRAALRLGYVVGSMHGRLRRWSDRLGSRRR